MEMNRYGDWAPPLDRLLVARHAIIDVQLHTQQDLISQIIDIASDMSVRGLCFATENGSNLMDLWYGTSRRHRPSRYPVFVTYIEYYPGML